MPYRKFVEPQILPDRRKAVWLVQSSINADSICVGIHIITTVVCTSDAALWLENCDSDCLCFAWFGRSYSGEKAMQRRSFFENRAAEGNVLTYGWGGIDELRRIRFIKKQTAFQKGRLLFINGVFVRLVVLSCNQNLYRSFTCPRILLLLYISFGRYSRISRRVLCMAPNNRSGRGRESCRFRPRGPADSPAVPK